MSKIYITHCSWIKNNSLEGTDLEVTPDKLYTARFIQRLIKRCREVDANWAIFSDEYGVVFPDDKLIWYDKSPTSVTPAQYLILLNDFISKMSSYKVWFYHNPSRFHRLYKKLIQDARAKGIDITLFSHIDDIR